MGVVTNEIKIAGIEANFAGVMTSVSAIKTTADSAKARADQAVLWSERKGYVGKNFLKNEAASDTIQGVTYTVNSDKSVTVHGTAAYESGLNLNPAAGGYTQYLLPEGNYVLSDGGVGTANCYVMIVRKKGSSGTPNYDVTTVNGRHDFTVDYSEYDYFNISIHIKAAHHIDEPGITFYPMIRKASVDDSTYEPYLPSNDDLLQTATLKSVTAAAADFAAFKTAIAAL